MRARKAVSRKAWFWARSPKLPPSMRVMVSMTRWDGAREAKAWVTRTRVGRVIGSSVMNGPGVGGLVGPADPVEGGRQGHLILPGHRGGEVGRGREQVAAGLDVGPGGLVRVVTAAAELD